MTRCLLLLILPLLAACPKYVTLGRMTWAQDYQTHNTVQKCSNGAEVVAEAERDLAAILETAKADGYVQSVDEATRRIGTRNGVCLIDEPETCGGRGPYGPKGQSARKAGCAYGGSDIWVSRWWPPICTSEWPTEPHCVAGTGQVREEWRNTLLHELGHLVMARLGIPEDTTKDHVEPFWTITMAKTHRRLGL
ncbi:MAG: hypothetical protein MUC88_00510 [Planctomycetes bacterium]|nr:hypothetical protein [Planctomycetota bacterium]